jgi:hypothetical protein
VWRVLAVRLQRAGAALRAMALRLRAAGAAVLEVRVS